MCFSASASFIAGAALIGVGIIAISQVRKPAHLLFAGIPLLFAIQQIFEGFLWLSLTRSDYLHSHTSAKYGFLVFAQFIWPFWVPLSFYCIERFPERRKILRYFLFAGIAVSLLLAYRLLFSPVVAKIDDCHISYEITSSTAMQVITWMLYLTAIIVPPFFSTWRNSIYLAITNLAALIITQVFYEAYLVSVWCFFAALQSIMVLVVLREMRRKLKRNWKTWTTYLYDLKRRSAER